MVRASLLASFSALLLACGGNVVVDHAGAAGNGGSGGGSSTSSSGPSSSSTTSSGPSSSSTGTPTSCPDPGKVAEDGFCQTEGLSCPMAHTCCSGGAVCKGGKWHFIGQTCGLFCTQNCGPDDKFACEGNAVCVADELDVGLTYRCKPNPCNQPSVNCGCGASVCSEDGLSCAGSDGFTVTCDCPPC